MNTKILNCILLACAINASAQLVVGILPTKVSGQKAIVSLSITNNLAEPVESARAVCFLLDDQGKMVSQSSKWVIGGTKDRPPLQPKLGTSYNFVITTPQSFAATNLTAKLNFTRVVLAGQKLADPKKVQIQNAN